MPLVKLFGNLRRHVADHQIEIAGDTVRSTLLDLCADNRPLRRAIFERDRLRPHVRVTVNGFDIELREGLETPLSPEDEVAVFPPIAGGGEPKMPSFQTQTSVALMIERWHLYKRKQPYGRLGRRWNRCRQTTS